ncbi:hypothetical protein [Pediococcus pentosaceus]|uniref:hypothetical protein n=1 Tax=Pediococcus pentosaceus TaxID=1255 RepID=UPI001327F401|nr:hypothetical protein [Pediococcus pentosaceus]KAF0501185.1 hypothetical protein GBP22_09725 [Pediococcus pentosaceus]
MSNLIVLTRAQRKLLKKLIKRGQKFKNNKIPIEQLGDLDFYNFDALKISGLIIEEYPYMPDATEDEMNAATTFLITDESLHYFEKYREYKFEQFLNGVAWPVVVATITSLIVNTPNWLPVLLEWMK